MKTFFTSRPVNAPKAATLFRTVLLAGAAVLGSFGAALAHVGPQVNARQAGNNSLALTVENPAKKPMRFRVTSLKDRRDLINEVNRQSSYGCKLDFSGLPAGTYAVLVNVGGQHYRYTVQVQSASQTTISVAELGMPGVASAVL